MTTRRVRVLVVDDSAFVRKLLEKGLGEDGGIEVVGVAADAYQARDLIVEKRPDVVTLDIEMPRMDGLEFLRKLMPQFPLPVIVISSLSEKGSRIALNALELGAVDVVAKPSGHLGAGLGEMMNELRVRVKIAATANVSHWKHQRVHPPATRSKDSTVSRALAITTDRVIAIGASTGGTEALRCVLESLPSSTPGIVVVQHMPPGFTKMFAERLNVVCEMEAKEAQNGDRILTGRILVAPGAFQLTVHRSGGVYEVRCGGTERVNGHCPSVDVLMNSVAHEAGANAIGVMLTGMGRDGAEGMLAMRRAGARTLAQDEASCVVFGMPREAFANGGAERLVPLNAMAGEIQALVDEPLLNAARSHVS